MLKDILAISGQPGLFKKVSQAANSIIVESLITGKRVPAYSSNKIIALEDIAIFTDEEEVPLKTVLKAVFDKHEGGKSIDHKSSAQVLQSYFAEVLPTYDRNRVYVSDIKKLIQWYNILQEHNLLNFEEEPVEEEPVEEPAVEEPAVEEKEETKK